MSPHGPYVVVLLVTSWLAQVTFATFVWFGSTVDSHVSLSMKKYRAFSIYGALMPLPIAMLVFQLIAFAIYRGGARTQEALQSRLEGAREALEGSRASSSRSGSPPRHRNPFDDP